MLHLLHSLVIHSSIVIFLLVPNITSNQWSIGIGWCEGIKDPYIKNTLLPIHAPEDLCCDNI